MGLHLPSRRAVAELARTVWLPAMGLAALAVGAGAAARFAAAGLTLSHYDAKAHLVVARRILDSLTPGWMQIGAVWLPLPHLLNVLPVQADFFYRTGAFGVGLSVLAFGVTVYLVARIVFEATGSRLAALAGAAAFGSNPDVLYLQSTPMTEPLLMVLTVGSVWLGIRTLRAGPEARTRPAGLALSGACLTRYEAWPITAAFLVLAFAALLREGRPVRAAVRLVGRLAAYPAAGILAFLLLSRATVGEWFVNSGFFVPENAATGRPALAAISVWWGLHRLAGYPLVLAGAAGLLLLAGRALTARRLAAWLPVLALAGAAALPMFAFYSGHPFRIRYMIPLIPAVGIGVGCAVGLAGRAKLVAAAAVGAALVAAPHPLDPAAPMVLEAQWDRSNQAGRGQVAAYLRRHWDGEPVMASMGSLAHFMQELASDGHRVRDFLHEGNGDIWLAALESPGPHAEWMLIEEYAEGGDMLAVRARQRPRFLAGYDRVAEGGGVALYHRRPLGGGHAAAD
jgi:hypothetical protein